MSSRLKLKHLLVAGQTVSRENKAKLTQAQGKQSFCGREGEADLRERTRVSAAAEAAQGLGCCGRRGTTPGADSTADTTRGLDHTESSGAFPNTLQNHCPHSSALLAQDLAPSVRVSWDPGSSAPNCSLHPRLFRLFSPRFACMVKSGNCPGP